MCAINNFGSDGLGNCVGLPRPELLTHWHQCSAQSDWWRTDPELLLSRCIQHARSFDVPPSKGAVKRGPNDDGEWRCNDWSEVEVVRQSVSILRPLGDCAVATARVYAAR